LQTHLDEVGPLAVDDAVPLVCALADALTYVHGRGLTHRDIKPANILLRDPDHTSPVLIDFGLVRSEAGVGATLAGDTAGYSIQFAAPEQLDPDLGPIGPHTDVWALAATLLYAVRHDDAKRRNARTFKLRHAPEQLRDVLAAALDNDWEDRTATAEAFRSALAGDGEGPEPDEPDEPDIVLEPEPQPPPPVPRFKVVEGFTWLREETFSGGGQRHTVQVYRCDAFARALGLRGDQTDVAAEFVLIPAGEFTMGSPESEAESYDDERPQTRVRIGKPFLLARTEVCQRVWRGLVGSTGLDADPSRFDGERLPVERVSWDDVAAWCEANGLRLPSESEWEYACRAGTTGPFWFGSTITPSQVNYDGNWPYGGAAKGEYREQTVDVGSLPANAFGLFEVHGNVWEWCQDAWHGSHEGHPGNESARDAPGASRRVRRGGGWFGNARNCRSAVRVWSTTGFRDNYLGFRPARSYDFVPSASPSAPRRDEEPQVEANLKLLGSSPPQRQPEPPPPPAEPAPRFKAVEGFTLLPQRDWVSDDVPVYRSDAFAEALGLSAGQRHSAAEFVLIPAGTFTMGSPPDEPGRYDDEGPQTEVRIREPFLLARTPVVQGVWAALAGKAGLNENPSRFKNAGHLAPVERVSWDDVVAWCRAVGLRLPSESEWEYACRAGTTTALPNGPIEILGQRNAPAIDPIGWYGGNSGVDYDGAYDSSGWSEKQVDHSRAGTHPVGKKQANAFGLYDVIGNVWEWCQDAWHDSHEGHPGNESARDAAGASRRVLRGGSWRYYAEDCRSAVRFRGATDYRVSGLGFRPARSCD
jgi:formylglycine-generating enzyme required for sulfatase activity